MNNTDFYIKNLSYSQLRTFVTNTWEWQNSKLLWIYDNTVWVAWAVWTILHKFVEKYLKNWNIEDAINEAYKCLYDGEDWNTYLIDVDEVTSEDKLDNIKQHWRTKVVDFWKTWSNEKILKDVKSWIEAFLSEQVDYWKLIAVEKQMEYEANDILWWNIKVESPIPFTAISDEICRTTSVKNLMVDWELQTLEPWVLFIEDTKFKSMHSAMSEEDPKYIFQAFFNFYCARAEYWEEPKFMIFREIKTSKNKDWSSQHQTITIPFFWESFELYKVFFWRYITETFERIKLIQDRDFIFNIFDLFNGSKEWDKQKAYYLWVWVGQLQNKIAMTQKNKIWNNTPVMWDRTPLEKHSKKVKWDISLEDLNSIENKIRVTFQNFWFLVKFEKKVDWYSYDQYLFSTSRWTRIKRIKELTLELNQSLELKKSVRIELNKWTKFIWIEIPRDERRFANLNEFKIKTKKNKPLLPIWTSIIWEVETIDLSDADTSHVIIAWQSWSWKSEFMKTAIHSLKSYWNIIIIDPKRVWLIKVKKYADTYLTDIDSIALYLRWVVDFMMWDYERLEKMWLESIYEYKEKNPKWKDFQDNFIFIDELATLSSAIQQIDTEDKKWNPKVEDYNIWNEIMWYIAKIANLWRAVWYHLIMATQRPSIKVIPWDIKANISCRICFALATETDSKVVIDEWWAEDLLGKWDMLFMNRWIERLQWFYI